MVNQKKVGIKTKSIVLSLLLLSISSCGKVNSNVNKKALLVVSFGTSFSESRKVTLDATEEIISQAYPGYDKFRAFTSQIIIDVYKDRDNLEILNIREAIESIYKKGYGEVLVVPTLVINGEEYDEIIQGIEPFKDLFAKLIISKPLLTSPSDYERVAKAIIDELPQLDDKTAVVLMGHGTPHDANSAYPAFDYVFKHMGFDNIYVGTVEGFPSFDNVADDIKKKDYETILLQPLMMVAGDHANNDMAGDEADSWKVLFTSMGYNVKTILKGMGELTTIQNLFVEHSTEAVKEYGM